ncbi:MAG: glucose-6-phosphate dehydrogenase [Candidatus Rifleibacteriota bacterium]
MTNFFCASSIVIFGGTGDLASRKLIPALCRLQYAKLLINDFHIFVTGRSEKTSEAFLADFAKRQQRAMADDQAFKEGFEQLKNRIIYIKADPDTSDAANDFKSRLESNEKEAAPARLFYLAVPPDSMHKFIELIKPFSEKNKGSGCPVRILVEKPFGHNLQTAIELNNRLLASFSEEQILRIDHYLGKEAVQNILFMRFANIFFEPLWNNQYIDNVQISFAESIGIGNRAEYFDKTGILRDVVQNHLLQVLCLVAMEPPLSNRPEHIRIEKTKVLKAIRKYSVDQVPEEVIRARYISSTIKNVKVNSYLEESGVASNSSTETYAACRLLVDNWRWSGVPFYLRAGKRLDKNLTEICINFKRLPHSIFSDQSPTILANRLYIRIQPNEGITIKINSKPPGMDLRVTDVELKFSYEEEFGSYRPDAYERLLQDSLQGNSALFISSQEIEEAWKIIDPIIEAWKTNKSIPIHEYPAGSEGPIEALELLAKHGHCWFPSVGKAADCKQKS